jgi:hypothetical protein
MLISFVLVSRVGYSLKRAEPLQWTAHMDECLQVLSEHPECLGDELLVAEVKMQLIVEQVARGPWLSPDYKPPPYFISTLQAQLKNVKNTVPLKLHELGE